LPVSFYGQEPRIRPTNLRGFCPKGARQRRNGGVIDNSDLFEGAVL
jgi:hypothetical protein